MGYHGMAIEVIMELTLEIALRTTVEQEDIKALDEPRVERHSVFFCL